MTKFTETNPLDSSVQSFIEKNTDIINMIKTDIDLIEVLNSNVDNVTVKYYDVEREISKFAWETFSKRMDSMIEEIECKMDELHSVDDRMRFVHDICNIEHISNELSIMTRGFIKKLTSVLAKDR